MPCDNAIDQVRRQISNECFTAAPRPRGVFTLSVPTGGGKTLASLRFSLNHARTWQHDRIIYVVPYTTIIDQNAQETRDILEKSDDPSSFSSVVLEHHSNLTPEEETPKSKILTENWDAPVIYTTMVQFLDSLFAAGTQSVRRMHQLANATIIFDEIQLIPLRTVHLFCNAINFLVHSCGSSVVFCTATQPLLNEVDPLKGAVSLTSENEIVSEVATLFSMLKRVEISDARKPGGWTLAEISDLADRYICETGSCLIVVNTKQEAESLYRLCMPKLGEDSTVHLSTNMCPAHCADVLLKIWKRIGKKREAPTHPGPLLCVSTQLIEAGVDVDFGSVIRFAAGLDSVMQAAGRCNRNGRRKSGPVAIVNPAEENLDYLPDILAGRDSTFRVLDEYAETPDNYGNDLLSPSIMESYFRYYFFGRKHLMDYPVRSPRQDTLLNILSKNEKAGQEHCRITSMHPKHYWRQSFMSAARQFAVIDAPTRGVIVPYKEGIEIIADLASASDLLETKSLIRKAQRYSVNVFPWQLKKLGKAVAEVQHGTGILYLLPQFYSMAFGLNTEPVSDMPFLVAEPS